MDYREIFAEYCHVYRPQKKIVINNGIQEAQERATTADAVELWEDPCEANANYLCNRCQTMKATRWTINQEKETLCESCVRDWLKYALKNQKGASMSTFIIILCVLIY